MLSDPKFDRRIRQSRGPGQRRLRKSGLAKRICRTRLDDETVGDLARKSAIEMFSVERMASDYLSLYREVQR